MKRWFEAANLDGLAGATTLRKTWQRFHHLGSKTAGELANYNDSADVFKPVEALTLQETVYRELLQAIFSGRIPPGERLVSEKIAKQMNVSQTPVRGALHRLQAAGLITPRERRSSVVNELSPENLQEIYQIRLTLEPMAASKAASICRPEIIQQLELRYQEFIRATKARDVEGFLKFNKEFHHTIYRTADMPILQQIIDDLWMKMGPYLHILMRELLDQLEVDWTVKSHQGMLEGMSRRDPEEVCKWLRADLSGAEERIVVMFTRARSR